MKFTDSELSKRLVELGCIANQPYAWCPSFKAGLYVGECPASHKHIQAFTILDFLSDSEAAIQNCKRVFPEYWEDDDLITTNDQRHALLDAPDQLAYLANAVREVGK